MNALAGKLYLQTLKKEQVEMQPDQIMRESNLSAVQLNRLLSITKRKHAADE